MKTFPVNPETFDGGKFAARYGLTPFSFWIVNSEEGTILYAPDSVPDSPIFDLPDPFSGSMAYMASANNQLWKVKLDNAGLVDTNPA